jgi:hypothetical protein
MNRRSLFSRMAAAAAGIVLASSVEIMGFRAPSLVSPQETLRTISLLTRIEHGPIIPKINRDDKQFLPQEPEAPEGFHIVSVKCFSGESNAPVWVDAPEHGEGMGHWSIVRSALPEGISLEEYNEMKPSVGNVIWERSSNAPTWSSIMSRLNPQAES